MRSPFHKQGNFLSATESTESQSVQEVLEPLQLGFEEAFYLVQAGLLDIFSLQGEILNLMFLWKHFCSLQENFPPSFFAFSHYKKLGWVPKNGLKFGGDFVLYPLGPSRTHAKYVVNLKIEDENGTPRFLQKKFDWNSIVSSVRVVEVSVKELLICTIVVPSNVTDFLLCDVVKSFRLDDCVLSRWVP